MVGCGCGSCACVRKRENACVPSVLCITVLPVFVPTLPSPWAASDCDLHAADCGPQREDGGADTVCVSYSACPHSACSHLKS